MWNYLDLQCPIDDLVAYPPQDHYIMENLRDFVTVLTTSADTLTSENPLWNEMKILQNIQVKYKRILRCDRFLIHFQRVGHCLRKMVLLNLSKSYLDLAERFLVGFQDILGTPRLPSRQQVEYLLLRTLSASKLVCEAITYSREAFCYLIQKLKVGHLILDLIMATSIIARVNILLRATLEQLCSMYKQVLFWRYKVKRGEFQWTEKINFPQDIEVWIKSYEPAHSKPLSMSKDDIDRVKSMLNQTNGISNEAEASDTESVILVNEIKMDPPEADISIIETDCGEVIPRAKTKSNGSPLLKKKAINTSKLMKKKKIETSCHLTKLQKSLLQRMIKVQSLKDLGDMWFEIKSYSPDNLPKTLTAKRKEMIDKSFTQLKSVYSDKQFNKTYKTRPDFVKKAIIIICKKLGFTASDIRMCSKKVSESPNEVKISNSPAPKPLVPVNKVKGLRLLYKQLKAMLKFKNEPEKLMLLTNIFEHRITDIKLLKEKGEKVLAKKLIRCTSKEFLALYQ